MSRILLNRRAFLALRPPASARPRSCRIGLGAAAARRRAAGRRRRFRADQPQPGHRRLERRVLRRQQGGRAAGRSLLRRQGRARAAARHVVGRLGRRPNRSPSSCATASPGMTASRSPRPTSPSRRCEVWKPLQNLGRARLQGPRGGRHAGRAHGGLPLLDSRRRSS